MSNRHIFTRSEVFFSKGHRLFVWLDSAVEITGLVPVIPLKREEPKGFCQRFFLELLNQLVRRTVVSESDFGDSSLLFGAGASNCFA